MLGRYVATERKDLVFEPVNRVAWQYVNAVLENLERGDWPASTRQAELTTLPWRFGSRGAPLHEIVIFDAAGQDLRQILIADKQDSLTAEQRSIRIQIDAADVLVYLLDLNGFLGSNDLSLRDENAWLFKTFLTKPEWRAKRRLVVLSKAEIYAAMLASPTGQEAEEAKVRELVKQHLPTNYTLDHIVDSESTVSYSAITSVVTKTAIDHDGKPVRLPAHPLKSIGLYGFVDTLNNYAAWLIAEERRRWLNRIAKHVAWAMPVLIAFWFFFLFLFHLAPCFACAGRGTIACQVCGGSGNRPAMGLSAWWRSTIPCSVCQSKGSIPCPQCHGKGKFELW